MSAQVRPKHPTQQNAIDNIFADRLTASSSLAQYTCCATDMSSVRLFMVLTKQASERAIYSSSLSFELAESDRKSATATRRLKVACASAVDEEEEAEAEKGKGKRYFAREKRERQWIYEWTHLRRTCCRESTCANTTTDLPSSSSLLVKQRRGCGWLSSGS